MVPRIWRVRYDIDSDVSCKCLEIEQGTREGEGAAFVVFAGCETRLAICSGTMDERTQGGGIPIRYC